MTAVILYFVIHIIRNLYMYRDGERDIPQKLMRAEMRI